MLKVGASSVLEIPFQAYPLPKVTWTFNGGLLPSTTRFTSDTIFGMTALRMAKVVKKDTGKLAVKIENEFGSKMFNVALTVIGKY